MSALAGRVALVTGASRGIGAAVARRLAGAGAKVAIHGRDEAALAAVAREIQGAGGAVVSVAAELTRWGEVEAMRCTVEARLGPVDVLVANAGGAATRTSALEELSEESWRADLDGNLTATFLTLKSVLPGMKARRSGTIVTISSAAARRPHPRSPLAYAVAKAGIELLTQDVAAQAGPFGVRANCLAPETILTQRNQQEIPAATQTSLAESHPLQRLGTPDDVARAALFLASDESAWITGIVLDVAGGAVMPR